MNRIFKAYAVPAAITNLWLRLSVAVSGRCDLRHKKLLLPACS